MKRFMPAMLLFFLLPLVPLAQTPTATTARIALFWNQPAPLAGQTIAGFNVYKESVPGACTAGSPSGSNCDLLNNAIIIPYTPTTAACPTTSPAPCYQYTDIVTLPAPISTVQTITLYYVVRNANSPTCNHSPGTCESQNSNEAKVVLTIPVAPTPPPGNLNCAITITPAGVVTGTCQ